MRNLVLGLAFIFGALFIATLAGSYSSTNLLYLRVVLMVAAVMTMFLGAFNVYRAGVSSALGLPIWNDVLNELRLNEVYETVSVTPYDDNMYIVLIHDRRRGVRAYKLTEVPPKSFKVVVKNGIRSFEEYPRFTLIK